MEAISDLPTPGDMNADYSPQYVKLARLLRGQITSGACRNGTLLPATVLAAEHKVSKRVAMQALEMLEDNRYVRRARVTGPYTVTWQAAPDDRAAAPGRPDRQ